MSKIEVNAIEPQCGTNLTVGASGDTITFPSGTTVVNNGSQTGFGRTGTVDWNTTAITADPANAVSGTGYFANTTSAAFTITLPTSPSAGDIVAVRDYAQTFATNNLTIGRNSQPIDGQTFDLVLNTNGAAVTLVYVDGTQGWKSVNSNEITNSIRYVAATGGTITTSGDYKIHTFTGPGTFTVSCDGNPAGSDTVDYLVVAGGGGGGGYVAADPSGGGGGGGAGGYRESPGTASGSYTVSPLGVAPAVALPVTVTGYPITVGGGGPGTTPSARGTNGSNSIFSTITSAGGGIAGSRSDTLPCRPQHAGNPGGSGGGASGDSPVNGLGGVGNTPPVSPPQGQTGGAAGSSYGVGPAYASAGGGGATVAGANASPSSGGNGGAGATSSINGTPTARAGGGGGGAEIPAVGTGGSGGGGPGGTCTAGTNGTANTGGGGGGGDRADGGTGGSGIVIIRYKFQ